MARKPTLSPTKFSTYLACPVKYKWTYVDPKGKWYLRSRSYYSFGTSLHKALQRFYDSSDEGVKTVHQAVAALEEGWVEAGYSSQLEMSEALCEGKALLEEHLEEVLAMPTTAETLCVEKTLRLDLGDFVLLGRIDRIDRVGEDRLEVIDYKTGYSAPTPESVAEDLAMGVYQALVRHSFPGHEVKATIVALRSGTSASASLSQDEVAKLLEDLHALGVQILYRDYESVVPVPKPLCRDCDFLLLCQRHPDFALAPLPEEV